MQIMSCLKALSSPLRQIRRQLSSTHEVFNQGIPLENFNLFKSDPALLSFSKAFSDPLGPSALNDHGVRCGTVELMQTARHAESNKPILSQFDIYGRRTDVVQYQDSYHDLMRAGIEAGVSGYGFSSSTSTKGSHMTRAGLLYMQNQLEPGHCCPLVMTTAAIVPLRKHGYDKLATKLSTMTYDPRDVPIEDKEGVTAGMSMTEKQGGSDVRANTTTAQPDNPSLTGNGQVYRLTGHKWFTSAPMCDIFLTLANTTGHSAPSCFIVYRWIPDGGGRNTGFKVMRLKEKLGDRANASSEVEYDGAVGTMLGEEGRGVKTIIDMVQSTRLDCVLGSAGGRALQHVLMHTKHRKSFGLPLIDHPLMKNVVADLCLEAEAQTLTALYFSAVFDAANHKYSLPTSFDTGFANNNTGGDNMMELFRIGVAVSKYWVTKRHPGFVYECMECFGGNGFVEDFPMAMLFRQSPLNSIWEGSGNIIALDILRAQDSFSALMMDIKLACGVNKDFDSFVTNLESNIGSATGNSGTEAQRSARFLADHMALALQGSIMIRYGDSKVASTFIASRLSRDRLSSGDNYGSYVYDDDTAKFLIERNTPHFD